jgi:hypothetical protein
VTYTFGQEERLNARVDKEEAHQAGSSVVKKTLDNNSVNKGHGGSVTSRRDGQGGSITSGTGGAAMFGEEMIVVQTIPVTRPSASATSSSSTQASGRTGKK